MNSTLKCAAAAASALLITACGGSGDKFDGNASAGGGVSKGLIIGGEINIFAIEDGEVGTTPLTDTPSLTDENGQYTIRVPSSHTGDPILVRLSMAQDEANEVTTQMKCDLPAGCGGDIGFGDIYTPDADFVMEAILASARGNISASITPLTDIGAKLALARLEDNDDDELTATVIEFANSQVANRFGLSGTLTGQEIVDVTDPVSANTASADALRNSAIAAAVVAAVQNEQAALSIEDALASFVEEFVDEGIADKDDAPDATTTTLTEIFQQADAVLAETEQAINEEFEEGGASNNFSSARTEVQNDRDDASGDNGSTTASQGSASPNAGADELAKAKAFVQQIRDLGGNLQDGLEDGAGAAEEMEMIAEMSQEDIDVALETTADSITAMIDAFDAYDEADDENKPSSYTSEDGIVVGIAVSGDKYTFTVDQEKGEESNGIDLVGVLNFTANADEGDNPDIYEDSYDECFGENGRTDCSGDGENSRSFSATLRELSITGDVEVGNATLSILDTTEISGSFSASDDTTFSYEQTTDGDSYDYSEEETYENEVTGQISLDLDVQLTVAAAQPKNTESQASEVVFTGGLSAGLTGFQLQETETETYNETESESSYEGITVSELEFDLVTFGLNGSVENDVGTRVAATVNVTIDGRNAVIDFSEDYEQTSNGQGFSYDSSTEDFEESEDNFIEASIAVTLVADIEGISDHTKIEFEGARSEFDSVTASLRVEYGVPGDDDGRLAQHLDVQATVENIQFEDDDSESEGAGESGGDSEESATTAFTITNQDGVEAELTDNGEDATGTIEVNGTTYATVTPEAIRYIDGTIESF